MARDRIGGAKSCGSPRRDLRLHNGRGSCASGGAFSAARPQRSIARRLRIVVFSVAWIALAVPAQSMSPGIGASRFSLGRNTSARKPLLCRHTAARFDQSKQSRGEVWATGSSGWNGWQKRANGVCAQTAGCAVGRVLEVRLRRRLDSWRATLAGAAHVVARDDRVAGALDQLCQRARRIERGARLQGLCAGSIATLSAVCRDEMRTAERRSPLETSLTSRSFAPVFRFASHDSDWTMPGGGRAPRRVAHRLADRSSGLPRVRRGKNLSCCLLNLSYSLYKLCQRFCPS